MVIAISACLPAAAARSGSTGARRAEKSSSAPGAKYVAPLSPTNMNPFGRWRTATRSSGANDLAPSSESRVASGSASVGAGIVVTSQRSPDAPTNSRTVSVRSTTSNAFQPVGSGW
jgi:hypothetical protein